MITALLIATAAASFGQTSGLTPAGTLNAGLLTPGRLAPALDGGVYVTDQAAGQVVRYTADGSVVGTYPISQIPVGIGVASDGRVFVARQDGTVGIYDPSFNSLGSLNPAPLTMTEPNDLAVHSATGEVFVVDSGAHRVLVFDGTTGALLRAWEPKGPGWAVLSRPRPSLSTQA